MAIVQTWAIDGSRTPAGAGRREVWRASQGATGVTLPTDLKVRQLAVPGGAVNIGPGGAVALSPYAMSESYSMFNDSTTTLAIPPTGGTGRTDYIIMRVRDWAADPAVPDPPDPLTAPGAEFARVSQITSLAYPFVPLAKIVIPASTGTITTAMITDLREVANPRSKRVVRAAPLTVATAETLTATGADGEFFPNAGGVQQADIPSWATRVIIRATWHGLTLPASNAWGRLWVGWGTLVAPTRRDRNTQEFQYNSTGAGSTASTDASVIADMYIPASYRGASDVQFNAFGRRVSGTGPTMPALSGYSLDLTFLEVADPSDS